MEGGQYQSSGRGGGRLHRRKPSLPGRLRQRPVPGRALRLVGKGALLKAASGLVSSTGRAGMAA
ncbi:hypothetical protein [Breoghania sp.]|uniref:hypothetical protein n=1 Tax=Breoghania sp. TaxID=2065378 RepID=UPI00261FE052|nr:hypothetical protein [Breoghania sp.]MDJ0932070.1 hypothetical protein [Breoghania sp.]